jgi:hypothetical protein
MRKKNVFNDELTAWLNYLEYLSDDKEALDKFEKKMVALSKQTNATLQKGIKAGLKELEDETGFDWSPYLEDFDVHDWTEGDFQWSIGYWLKERIKEEAKKLT